MPSPNSDYEKAHATYRAMAKAALEGNKDAQRDKSKVMNEIVQIEREAARAGTILSASYRGERIVVDAQKTRTKRSLQEEYIDKFDNESKVRVKPDDEKEQTLREWHRKRLLGE